MALQPSRCAGTHFATPPNSYKLVRAQSNVAAELNEAPQPEDEIDLVSDVSLADIDLSDSDDDYFG